MFYENVQQITNQKEVRVENMIKKVTNYMLNSKAYYNSFNSWIDKKDINLIYLAQNHKLDVAKLETTPVELSKLTDVVK